MTNVEIVKSEIVTELEVGAFYLLSYLDQYELKKGKLVSNLVNGNYLVRLNKIAKDYTIISIEGSDVLRAYFDVWKTRSDHFILTGIPIEEFKAAKPVKITEQEANMLIYMHSLYLSSSSKHD
jgi:hypothetical protein